MLPRGVTCAVAFLAGSMPAAPAVGSTVAISAHGRA